MRILGRRQGRGGRLPIGRRPLVRHDAGDTLVEVLISVTILAIAVVALMNAFTTVISGSSIYAGATTLDTVVRTATSEAATEIQQNAAQAFACPTNYRPTFDTPALASGYTAALVSEEYFTAAGTVNSCSSLSGSWALVVVVRVSDAAKGTSDTGAVVVDNPTAPAVPSGTTPSQLVFSQPAIPTQTAGSGFAVVVLVEDAIGRIVTSDFSTVDLSVSSGTISGCSETEVAGAITFSNCTIDKTGTYTLTATETSESHVSNATSDFFVVEPGPPSTLGFTGPALASTATAAQAFPVQPQVTVYDAYGNVVTTDASTVTLSITAGTGVSNATLSGCSESEAAGVVGFSGCRIDKSSATQPYSLTATDIDGQDTLVSPASTSFTVQPGPASQLVFTKMPLGGVSGAAFPVQPVITVEDAGGNVATADTSSVTLAIGSNPTTPASSFTCTHTTVVVNAGVATFAGCEITTPANGDATGFTLLATDPEQPPGGGQLTATTDPFAITGPATQLVWITSPSSTATAGSPFATQPVVAVEDAAGNTVTNDTSSVRLSLPPNSPVSCTTNPLAVTSGVATFAGCEINTVGTFVVTATDPSEPSLTPATSSVTVSPGAPTQLAFSTPPPASVTAGQAFGFKVSVEDVYGNVVTTDTSTVNVAIGANPGSGSLTGCTGSASASSGIATYSGCIITSAANGYTLQATDATESLTKGTSPTFNIVASTAAMLAFVTSPGNSTDGVAFAPQPVVAVEDMYGNPVTTDSSTVSLAIKTATGSGKLSSCAQSRETGGEAQFASCNIDQPGAYTLIATDNSLTSATSASFTISVGPGSQLIFSPQPPATAHTNVAMSTFAVQVEDVSGNLVTSPAYSIALSIRTTSGFRQLSISCTSSSQVQTVNGVASFASCTITAGGTLFGAETAVLTATTTILGTVITATSNSIRVPS